MENCVLCKRLAEFIAENRLKYPDFYNAPVDSFGDRKGRILIVGLAPGLKGANRTGRPFTADYAGDLLYPVLLDFGLAKGTYKAKADDGLILTGARITNAVRCVPPANKVTGDEIKTCNRFLKTEMENMPNLRVILALGAVAHKAVLLAVSAKQSAYPFAHAAVHKNIDGKGLYLVDSYHCSRYNTSTKVLTPEMFKSAVNIAKTLAETD